MKVLEFIMKNKIKSEIERIADLYGKSNLDYSKGCYDGYINRIIEDEPKRNRMRLLNMYDRKKNFYLLNKEDKCVKCLRGV